MCSASNPALVQSFRWPFQCSTTFESSTFPKLAFAHDGSRTFFLRSCKFSVFDGRYVFTTVHCHSASSVSRVRGVFVNKKRNFLKVFWSWNWFCCLPTETVVCEQLSSAKCHIRIICDNAFTVKFTTCCCETFDIESKANPKFLHRWEYFPERYQTVCSCKLRAQQLSDDRICQQAK